MDFQGKNVVYVGGFGGIGFATCKLLVKKKVAILTILDVKENAAYMKELMTLNPSTKIMFMQLDLCNKDQIEKVVNDVIETMKVVDVLVNGSGMINDKKPEMTMGVNLLGLIHTTMLMIPHMDMGNGGRGGMIVNIASVLGLEPCGCLAIYTASKHGVMGFSRSISDEHYFNRTGVAIMTICPGITVTGLWDTFHGNDTFSYSNKLTDEFCSAKNQDAEVCAVNFVKAMETKKNGSIWILDLGKLEEVKPTKYWGLQF
ncbi:alcohol dehydrogenase-like [Episyrphus balteatus]|uniref:alcohol dehydrogenase-like n=1 Tax=Episyrphus balteatus TaxID=286459 RepID=UPI0024854EFD|nr:alcohol dehydrogenase-like [Episyrphus balteatus]